MSKAMIARTMDELYSLEDINTVLLVRTDGEVLRSNIPSESINPDLIKSLEWVVSVVPSVTREMQRKNLRKVIYDLESSMIVFYNCGLQTLLVAFLEPTANLGLLLIELSRTAKIIRDMIEY